MNRRSVDEQEFIRELTEIIEANLKDENFGVSELAREVGISRSNLYAKVKSVTHKSASSFIREVRLKKAKKLLEQTTLTVSEVAYEVGFGSPTYFIKCFHDYYGIPPGEVEKIEAAEINSVDSPIQDQEPTLQKSKRKSKLITVVVLVLILSAVSIIVLKPFSTPKEIRERSIAVLPFKNLSEDIENQYFADGITEDIVHSLSLISGFRVISVQSTQQYRNTNKSLPEIGRELGVSYIVEGSVQRLGDNVKITIQFNNAKNDKLMWSASYNKELQDIFTLQSTIAGQIAEKLETVLTPQEEEQIGKRYTDNTEAYDLYIEGRFYYKLRTKENFVKSIDLYNQALSLDSNFCLAYAGLADSYLTGTFHRAFQKEQGISKSREYALRALSIDKNLAEANTTLGAISTYYDYNWVLAERELKLALKNNPAYARAYHVYAQYMDIIGRREEARKYINKYLELNPNDRWTSYQFYCKDGNWDKALDESKKFYQIDKNKVAFYGRNFDVYLLQHKYLEAINEFRKMTTSVSPGKSIDLLEHPASNPENTIREIVEIFKAHGTGPYGMAEYYAILGDKETALDYLEECFQNGDGWFVWLKDDKAFQNLKNEPRFIALLKKVNLTDEQLKRVSH